MPHEQKIAVTGTVLRTNFDFCYVALDANKANTSIGVIQYADCNELPKPSFLLKLEFALASTLNPKKAFAKIWHTKDRKECAAPQKGDRVEAELVVSTNALKNACVRPR